MVVVVAVATPALAHHPIINGSVSCPKDQQVITWSVGHAANSTKDMKIVEIDLSRGTLVGFGVGTVVPYQSRVTGTTTLPGDATGEVSLAITGVWLMPDGTVDDEIGEEVRTRVVLLKPCGGTTTTTTQSTTTTTAPETTTTTAPETTTTTAPETTTTTAATTTTTVAATTTTTVAPVTTTTVAPATQTNVAGVLIERQPDAPAAAPAAAPAVAAAGAAQIDQLPRTGTGTNVLAAVGITLVGLGSLLTRMSGRRRTVACPV